MSAMVIRATGVRVEVWTRTISGSRGGDSDDDLDSNPGRDGTRHSLDLHFLPYTLVQRTTVPEGKR